MGAFVLDSLEPDETADVRSHLSACDACAHERAELAALPTLLDAAAGIETAPATPPAALEEVVVHSYVSERHPAPARGSWFRRTLLRPIPAAGMAAAAAVAITLLVSAALNSSGSADHVYRVWLHGVPPSARAHATAQLASVASGTRVQLNVGGLAPAPDAVYELWCIRDDGSKMSAGTFRVDQAGRATVHLTTAARLGDYHRISVERTAAHGGGTRVMTGEIEY
jgi:anti-sigma factor RsiW